MRGITSGRRVSSKEKEKWWWLCLVVGGLGFSPLSSLFALKFSLLQHQKISLDMLLSFSSRRSLPLIHLITIFIFFIFFPHQLYQVLFILQATGKWTYSSPLLPLTHATLSFSPSIDQGLATPPNLIHTQHFTKKPHKHISLSGLGLIQVI